MIKPPSQQFPYTLVYSGDPALNLPTDPDGDEARTKLLRAKALEVARDTGDWTALIHTGEVPTLFTVRPITGALLDWMMSEARRRESTAAEVHVFALRVALTKIDGFGDARVETAPAGREGEFRIATMKIIDALYAVEGVGRDVVQELGSIVWQRALEGLRPKS